MVSFGGVVDGKRSSNVEITTLDPDNNFNCQIPNLPKAVSGHSTIKTTIGVISCGGFKGNDYTNKCHLLASNNSWLPFPPMIERRRFFAMAEGDGKIFSVGDYGGEDSMEWIDLKEKTSWTRQNLPFKIRNQCMATFNSSHTIQTGGVLNGKVNKRS